MKDFKDAKLATEELFADDIANDSTMRLQQAVQEIEALKSQNRAMYSELVKKNEAQRELLNAKKNGIGDKSSQKKKKFKFKKSYILITVYIVLIIAELFFVVPYHKMQIFVSNQNVPHTEIIGSGYTTMFEINDDDARVIGNKKTNSGKVVNTSQVIVNVSITTIVAIALYFMLQRKEKTKGVSITYINDIDFANDEIPVIDINNLAFATEEEIKQAQQEYAREIAKYIINKGVQNV